MMRRFARLNGGWVFAVTFALAVVPALLRATQRLGHGPGIKQVCGLSTSQLVPPDRVELSTQAANPAIPFSLPEPSARENVIVAPAPSAPDSVLVQLAPRSPPPAL